MTALKALLLSLFAALLLVGCGERQGANDTGASGQAGDSGMSDTAPGAADDETLGTPDAMDPPDDASGSATAPGTDPGTAESTGGTSSAPQPGSEGNTGETGSSTPSQ